MHKRQLEKWTVGLSMSNNNAMTQCNRKCKHIGGNKQAKSTIITYIANNSQIIINLRYRSAISRMALGFESFISDKKCGDFQMPEPARAEAHIENERKRRLSRLSMVWLCKKNHNQIDIGNGYYGDRQTSSQSHALEHFLPMAVWLWPPCLLTNPNNIICHLFSVENKPILFLYEKCVRQIGLFVSFTRSFFLLFCFVIYVHLGWAEYVSNMLPCSINAIIF